MQRELDRVMGLDLKDLETEKGRKQILQEALGYTAEELVTVIRRGTSLPEAQDAVGICYTTLLDVSRGNADAGRLNDIIKGAAKFLVPDPEDPWAFRSECSQEIYKLIDSTREEDHWLEVDFFSHMYSRMLSVKRRVNGLRIRKGITGRITKKWTEMSADELKKREEDRKRRKKGLPVKREQRRQRRLPHIRYADIETVENRREESSSDGPAEEPLSLETVCGIYMLLEPRQRRAIRLLRKGHPKAGEHGQKKPVSKILGTSRPTLDSWLDAAGDQMLQDEQIRRLLSSRGFDLAKLDAESAKRRARRAVRRQTRRKKHNG